MREVACVEDKGWSSGHGIDLFDGGLQRSHNIRVRGFAETDVTVAYLYKTEVRFFGHNQSALELAGIFVDHLAHPERFQDATRHHPQYASSCPCHASQE